MENNPTENVLARKDTLRGVSGERKIVLTGRQNGGGQGDRSDQTAHVRFMPDRRRSERRKSETDLGSVGR